MIFCYCVILNNDVRIFVIISRDIVVVEVYYYVLCYKSYINIKIKECDYVGDNEVVNLL